MEMADPRQRLLTLSQERGVSLSRLSALLSRNPSYLQQFVRKGSPRKLEETDRATLARFFGVSEDELGAPEEVSQTREGTAGPDWIDVPRLELGVSAGPGALDPDAKVELIDGEVIEMAPEGMQHVRAKMQLAMSFMSRAGDAVRVIVDSTLRLSSTSAPDPDLYLYDAALALDSLDGASVGLVIEVSGRSLARDISMKAELYARNGVRDYWVVDVAARKIIIHRDPRDGAYGSVSTALVDEAVAPLAFPDLPLRLSDLPVIR